MIRSRSAEGGLSLLEVMIAIAVLAIGVLAAAGLQASGLEGSRSATQTQALHAEARNELAAWRANLATATYTVPTSGGCLTDSQRCTVEIRPCALVGGNLDCTQAQVATPIAQALIVTVATGDQSVALRTVVAGGLP
jgi:prepilin-type N-terminal cleavage/methylation domain-containing protein